jgi:hypothetical protein
MLADSARPAGPRKSHAAVAPDGLGKRGYHHDVLTRAVEPALKCGHAIPIVTMESIDVNTAQGRMAPAQPARIPPGCMRNPELTSLTLHPCGVDVERELTLAHGEI